MINNKYSDWFKIDLHIHTDWSKKTKDNDYKGIFSVEKLHEKLTANQVGIFSLTDHNIINLPAYEEYYTKYNNESPLLLIGVELDIKLDTNSNKRDYHSLLIFKDSTIENVRNISEKLERKYIEKGITDEKIRKLTIKDIVDTFYNDEFFFIPHANNGGDRSITETYKGKIFDAQRMILLMPSALEKVPEEVVHIYNDGFDKVLNDSFKSKEVVAYINFSDNHFIEQYPCKHMGDAGTHDFCFIKGSKNYETLRLAFIDPKSRIKTVLELTKLSNTNNIIEGIKFQDETLINNSEILFSPHLNVIIGGRSSGKSLLMNLLGKKIDKVSIDDKYQVNSDNVLIKSNRDSDYKSNTSITDNLIYIKQGDIVNYFEKNELKELAKKSGKFDEYSRAKEEFKNKKELLNKEIDKLIYSYHELFEIGESKNYELHNATVESILSNNFILKFDKESLAGQIDNSEQIIEIVGLLENSVEQIEKLKEYNILEFDKDETFVITEFEKLLDVKLKLINGKKSLVERKLDFINAVSGIIDSKNGELNAEAQQKTYSVAALKQLKDEIKDRFKRLRKLKHFCDSIEHFDYSLKKQIQLSENVKLSLDVVKSNEIGALILDGINDADVNNSLFLNFYGLITGEKSLKIYRDSEPLNLKKKIQKQIEELEQSLIEPIDYLEYRDGSTSKNNSPGFNSEQYLRIVLKNPNNKIVFIDQPEDNLGNRFITDELVNIIREIKFEKQLFLVTHNPSIVVYGDAECIVKAKNEENRITYTQTVLEDQNAQKDICSILDGGEYIFDNRSKKYNIKRILKENS